MDLAEPLTAHDRAQLAADEAAQSKILRRRTTVRQRLTPCEFCGYPLSQRHHAVPISLIGESAYTLQLCANCHELFHIVQDLVVHKRLHAARLLNAWKDTFGEDDIRLHKSYHFLAAAMNIVSGNP